MNYLKIDQFCFYNGKAGSHSINLVFLNGFSPRGCSEGNRSCHLLEEQIIYTNGLFAI